MKVSKDKKAKSPEEKEKEYYATQFRAYKQLWSRSSPKKARVKDAAKLRVDDGYYKWKCADCALLYAESEINIDHIVPVNRHPINAEEWKQSFELNESDDLQVLCLKCHKKKTASDLKKKAITNCINEIEEIRYKYGINTSPLISFSHEQLKKARTALRKYEANEIDAKKREKALSQYYAIIAKV